jgi:hypothetical protein
MCGQQSFGVLNVAHRNKDQRVFVRGLKCEGANNDDGC